MPAALSTLKVVGERRNPAGFTSSAAMGSCEFKRADRMRRCASRGDPCLRTIGLRECSREGSIGIAISPAA
jgi:hypothetical protein